jgi:hypothetical protein
MDHELKNVIHSTVTLLSSLILGYLRNEAQEDLKFHIQDKLPEEYQNCMVGIKPGVKNMLGHCK